MRKSKVTLPPQPVGRPANRLGSSALGGITETEWRQSGGTEGTTDGAETDSITASSAPVLPAANRNI